MGFFSRRRSNIEKAELEKKKHENDTRFNLALISGKENINDCSHPTMWIKQDGIVYFEEMPNTFYRIIDFEWDGPSYETYTVSHTEGKETGHQKRKGRIIGATVGTVLMPGIGTAVGAAYGNGNKKSTNKIVSDTITSEQHQEKSTLAALKLADINSDETFTLTFNCLTNTVNRIAPYIPYNNEDDE